MDDITLRALKTLQGADAIITEDTRTYRKLAERHAIPNKPVYSLYKGNESARVEQILPMLAEGLSAALVSESGTPAVSDPGALLVRRCLDAGIQVIPVPGPSTLTAAMSIAGIFSGPITFFGFLPKKNPAADVISALDGGATAVFFERPDRLPNTLRELAAGRPDTRLVVARELTKRFEEIWSARAADAARICEKKIAKGEVVVVAEPPAENNSAAREAGGEERMCKARETLSEFRNARVPLSTAARLAARFLGMPRRELYREALVVYSGKGSDVNG